MVLTTQNGAEYIRDSIPEVEQTNFICQLSGISIFVLPDNAFVGLFTDEGRKVDTLIVTGNTECQIKCFWGMLRNGSLTLAQLREFSYISQRSEEWLRDVM